MTDPIRVRVRLDWLIEVHQPEDPNDALSIADGYVADQPLYELVDFELVTANDPEAEVTVALYPDNEKVPDGWAPWATYHR